MSTPPGWEGILHDGERILWQGQPDQRLFRLRSSDAFLIPFSLAWGGFAIFWNVIVWTTGAPFFFRLFGLPFLIIGLHIMIGRFFLDAARRRNTWYTLTNQRAFIGENLFRKTLRDHSLAKTTSIELSQGRNGSITFAGGRLPFTHQNGTASFSGRPAGFTFELLDTPEEVYRLAQNARKALT